MPIDPSMAVSGAEWQIQGLPGLNQPSDATAKPGGAEGGGFGDMLSSSISALSETQAKAAGASQAFAAGTITDPTQVVMAVEKAQLSMQLASQLRAKGVEAYQDIFHTQV